MGSDAVGMNLRIAKNGLHRVLLDADIADECNLRDVLGNLEVVLQFQTFEQWITDSEFGSEEPEVVFSIPLTIVATTDTKASHIAELAKVPFHLREQIERRGTHVVDSLGIALIYIMTIPLTVLYARG